MVVAAAPLSTPHFSRTTSLQTLHNRLEDHARWGNAGLKTAGSRTAGLKDPGFRAGLAVAQDSSHWRPASTAHCLHYEADSRTAGSSFHPCRSSPIGSGVSGSSIWGTPVIARCQLGSLTCGPGSDHIGQLGVRISGTSLWAERRQQPATWKSNSQKVQGHSGGAFGLSPPKPWVGHRTGGRVTPEFLKAPLSCQDILGGHSRSNPIADNSCTSSCSRISGLPSCRAACLSPLNPDDSPGGFGHSRYRLARISSRINALAPRKLSSDLVVAPQADTWQTRRSHRWQQHDRCRGPRPPSAWWDKWIGRGSDGPPAGGPEGYAGRPDGRAPGGHDPREGHATGGDREEGEAVPGARRRSLDDLLLGGSILFPEEDEKAMPNKQQGPGGDPNLPRLTKRQRMELVGGPEEDVDAIIEDENKFRAWWRRRQAILELRQAQDQGTDPDDNSWEDWLDESVTAEYDLGGWYEVQPDWDREGMPRSPPRVPERGMSRTFKELIFKVFDPRQEEVEAELSFEDQVFRYTSQTTAKFVVCLVVFPWLVGLVSHDFILVPFMHRWVETTPLVASVLDVRETQKLQVIAALKLERQRVRFEAEIGRTPPLSDEELAEHMHEEAVLLMEEVRAENQSAFANIWSDTLAGLTGFAIVALNPKLVSILRMTSNRIFTNISDTGKAFIIILLTDIFLGYHSESGWETVIEMFLEHYGLESSHTSIVIFVSTVPVTLDVCFKLWVFRYLNRLSPSAAATFREMKRH